VSEEAYLRFWVGELAWCVCVCMYALELSADVTCVSCQQVQALRQLQRWKSPSHGSWALMAKAPVQSFQAKDVIRLARVKGLLEGWRWFLLVTSGGAPRFLLVTCGGGHLP
jgi:hypothetical protein